MNLTVTERHYSVLFRIDKIHFIRNSLKDKNHFKSDAKQNCVKRDVFRLITPNTLCLMFCSVLLFVII